MQDFANPIWEVPTSFGQAADQKFKTAIPIETKLCSSTLS